mmetsp:Transcript_30863/g.57888  ORF Transcript_30863/g.57888 Transcript_30863/m.57888 type:complete len:218 (-) Transcript_30863:22-675(-)
MGLHSRIREGPHLALPGHAASCLRVRALRGLPQAVFAGERAPKVPDGRLLHVPGRAIQGRGLRAGVDSADREGHNDLLRGSFEPDAAKSAAAQPDDRGGPAATRTSDAPSQLRADVARSGGDAQPAAGALARNHPGNRQLLLAATRRTHSAADLHGLSGSVRARCPLPPPSLHARLSPKVHRRVAKALYRLPHLQGQRRSCYPTVLTIEPGGGSDLA